jgi:hypothetical protein
MKHVLTLAFLALASVSSLNAVEQIEDFLGLKFGANQAAAKAAMTAHGFKLDKSDATLTFKDGTYSGQPTKEVKLEFDGDRFIRATVVFEVRSGKREECARLGLEAYDQVKKALSDKYGPPASTTSVPRAKILAEKTPPNTVLKSIWRSQPSLSGERKSIYLSTVTMALYSWVFNVVYESGSGSGAARKDV